MKHNLNPCHHNVLVLGFIILNGSAGHWSKNDNLPVYFCHISDGLQTGDLIGHYPYDPYIPLIIFWDVLGKPMCWGLGELQTS